jgi:polyhydroxyalkanoate synthesis regulator phasin
MPQAPDWQRYLEAGMQFTEMRRSQARRVANDLVEQGHLAREQVASAVDEIVAISRRRTDEMREVVRKEVQRQLGGLGLATKADLAKLEKKMNKANRVAKTKAASKSSKTTTKKSDAAKKTAKKPAKKAG